MSDAFVLFRLGARTFASRLDDVREIARLSGLERLPATDARRCGFVLLRGAPVPVFDVRDGAPGDHGDVLVLDTVEGLIGVAVDRVTAVVPAGELPESDAPVRALPPYVVGVRRRDGEPVLVVDVQLLLDATKAAQSAQARPEPAQT